jgi:hypothetical protein
MELPSGERATEVMERTCSRVCIRDSMRGAEFLLSAFAAAPDGAVWAKAVRCPKVRVRTAAAKHKRRRLPARRGRRGRSMPKEASMPLSA